MNNDELIEYFRNISADDFFALTDEDFKKLGTSYEEAYEIIKNNNIKILKFYLENNQMKKVYEFDESLFTDDVLENSIDNLIEQISDSEFYRRVPWIALKSKKLLNYYLQLGDMEVALQFDSSLFTDEVIKQYLDEITTYIDKENCHNIKSLRRSQSGVLFNYYLEKDEIEHALCYATDEDVEANLEIFANYLSEAIKEKYYQIPDILAYNDALKAYLLKTSRVQEAVKLASVDNQPGFSDEVIAMYLPNIVKFIEENKIIPYVMKYSRKLFEYFVKNNRVDLILELDEGIIWPFIDKNIEQIAEYIEKNQKVPYSLISNQKLFLRFCKKGNYDIASQFKIHSLDKELEASELKGIADYVENIFYSHASKQIPEIFSESKRLFAYYLEHDKLDIALNFKPFYCTDDIIEKYLNKLVEYIKKTNTIPHALVYSKAILTNLLKNNEIDLAIKFGRIAFTEDIIANNVEKLAECVEKLDEIPIALCTSESLLSYLLKHGKVDTAMKFNKLAFTKKVLDENAKTIADYLIQKGYNYAYEKSYSLSLDECGPEFIYNKRILECVLKEEKFAIVQLFNQSLFDAQLINDNAKEFANYIMERNVTLRTFHPQRVTIYELISKDKQIFDILLQHNRIDLVLDFDSKFFADEIIDKYKEQITECLEKEYGYVYQNGLPTGIKNNKKLFNYFMQTNNRLAGYFGPEMYDEKYCKEHFEEILAFIKENGGENITKNLRSSSVLLELFLENDNMLYALDFKGDLFTEELMNTYYNKIIAFIDNYGKGLGSGIGNSKEALKCFIKRGRIDLITEFNGEILTEDIIQENFDYIAKSIENEPNNLVPYNLRENRILLKEYIKTNRLNIILQFEPCALLTEYIYNHYEDVKKYLLAKLDAGVKLDDLRLNYELPEQLFKLFLKNNDMDIVLKFPDDMFSEYRISDCVPAFANYIMKTGSVPSQIAKSESVLEYLLNENRIDLVFKFDEKLLDLKFILENMDRFNAWLQNKEDFSIAKFEVEQKLNSLLYNIDEKLRRRFASKYNVNIPYEFVKKLRIYPNYYNLLDKGWEYSDLITKMINVLGSDKFETYLIIYQVLYNLDHYYEFLDNLLLSDIFDSTPIGLTDEEAKKLISIFVKDNIYNIKTLEDFKNYDKIASKNHEQYMEQLAEKNHIETVRSYLLNYKFGLSYYQARELNRKYCYTVESIKESALPKEIKDFLISLNDILTTNDINKLKFMQMTTSKMENDYSSYIMLDYILRNSYAKLQEAQTKNNQTVSESADIGKKLVEYFKQAPMEIKLKIKEDVQVNNLSPKEIYDKILSEAYKSKKI